MPVDDEFDRPEFDAAKIANQMLADQPGRAARLAADDRRERLALGRVGTVVDDPGESQLPSAMTRPERIKRANLRPARATAPKLPSSTRNAMTAMQWWSWVAGPCGFV